jgi:hypothetical protein
MTSMIRKTFLAVRGGPGAAGIWIDKLTGRFLFDRKGGVPEAIQGSKTILVSGAAYTLLPEDDGAMVATSYAAGSTVVTLPSARLEGLTFTLALHALAGGGLGHSFSPIASEQILIGVPPAPDKDVVCSAATDRVGDSITVRADGSGNWVIVSAFGTWAKEV